jgi:transcription-repair coupling factor (superfamily II helicase)
MKFCLNIEDLNAQTLFWRPGEFFLFEGILDVFSFSNDEPYRLGFGNDVDSIRTFDVKHNCL